MDWKLKELKNSCEMVDLINLAIIQVYLMQFHFYVAGTLCIFIGESVGYFPYNCILKHLCSN